MNTDLHSFEKGLDQLEAMVQRLESQNLSLEESLKCYEDGIKLSEVLQRQLEEAKRKVEVLRQGLGGEYLAEPLEGDA
ncbi:MAG: exodeoxyribonuclease VII small subunit [Holophagales bacterium]|jgi:exodeoxyribonuclease VII small subunit|nr:exodeoxyribonuclease VII small subunit [Holophagales bacterium]